ncbi:hypothetical protein [Sphingorhabdus sp. Alg239-R122]|uniref:hypothetical protein n=1 Tax=Sphingorhabdus sp. Alg239-R122 TaxID=2305989 RepID=UPI0013DBC51E|nr:hypothetical protein [Sphingorhabdus sp. Alg239-R122]
MIFTALFTALLAQASPTAPVQQIRPLTDIHRRDMRCAAVFAIVASEQGRGVQSALEYPALGKRGKAYFADIGQRIVEQTGQPREAVQQEWVDVAEQLQKEARESNDPTAAVAANMGTCLPLLDAAVPPPDKPALPQCAIYLQLAYEEIYAREGLSPAAQDMKTLATVLGSRARDMLREQGKSGFEIDTYLFSVREKITADAAAEPDQNIDYEHCFELAKP